MLDVCCGSGASAIPAAKSVGPTGSVADLQTSSFAPVATKRHKKHKTIDGKRALQSIGKYFVLLCLFVA